MLSKWERKLNFKSQDTDVHAISSNSLSTMHNLDLEKIKQLQQGGHLTKIIDKCKSEKMTRHPII